MARLLVGANLIAITIATAIISCRPTSTVGNEEDGVNTLSPIDSKQNAAVTASIDAIGRIESAALEAKGTLETPSIADPIRTEIKNALLEARCTIGSSKNPNSYGQRHSFLNIDGNNCPLTAHIDSHYNPGVPRQGYTLFARFLITDPALRTKNDIYELQMSGRGQYDLNGGKGDFQLTATGSAKSITKGIIRISSSNIQKFNLREGKTTASGTQTIRLTFPSSELLNPFTIELKALISIKHDVDRTVYFKNGIDISRQEYDGYLAKFGIILE